LWDECVKKRTKTHPLPSFLNGSHTRRADANQLTRPVNTIDCDTNNLREGEKSVGGIKEKKGVGSIVRSCVSDDKEN
jgi:hypothetical protein